MLTATRDPVLHLKQVAGRVRSRKVQHTADHYKITGTRLAMLLLLLELFWGPLPAWLLRGSVGCWWVAQIVRRLE